MASCSQYAAAFGFQLYLVPVSACGIDLASVGGGLKAGGFIDPAAVVDKDTRIEEGAATGEILAGDPGVNVVYDGETVNTEAVFKLVGITNAGLETDTGTESVITYDEEGRGFDQSVAISKSWSIALEGVSKFEDAAYKVIRLLESNAVSGQLKAKVGRVGPVGTTEAIYGYCTVTNYSESVEAGGIVTWSAELQGYGPLAIDLDNTDSANLQGPISQLAVLTSGANLLDGSYTDQPLLGGAGNGLATADILVSDGEVATVTLVDAGDGYAQLDTLSANLPGAEIDGLISTLSISDAGANLADGLYLGQALTGGSGSGATAALSVSGGVVTEATLDQAGTGYTASDVLTVTLPAADNPFEGEVLSLGAVVSGSGYIDGSYSNLTATGGSGSGLLLNVTVTSGAVSGVTIADGGVGYTDGDSLTGALPAQIIPGTGEILTLAAGSLIGGADYTDDTYTAVPLTGGSGSGATATITVANGTVTGVVLVNGGSGYEAGDSLSASDANLGGSGIGSGFAISVATVDEDAEGPTTPWSVEAAMVDEDPTLAADQPAFTVTAITTEEATHTDPTFRVVALVGN